MKKIWNHYDSMDFSDSGEEAGYAPQSQQNRSEAPHKRSGWDRFYSWLFHAEEETGQSCGEIPLIAADTPAERALQAQQREQIQQALRDWKNAAAYFENVADPELVDFAVYDMEAAQRRYVYLLRNARNGGNTIDFPK